MNIMEIVTRLIPILCGSTIGVLTGQMIRKKIMHGGRKARHGRR